MRVEIRDCNGYNYMIQSENPATIGLWFTEMAGRLMSANAAIWQNTLIVTPTNDAEQKAIGNPAPVPFSDVLLKDLARVLNGAS